MPDTSSYLLHNVDAFHEALKRIKQARDNKFTRWSRRMKKGVETRDDPFIALLHAKYKEDNDHLLGEAVDSLLLHFGRVCREYGLRFVSISKLDLIGFEKVYWPPREGVRGRPVEWCIAETLAIWQGCGNSGQAQVNLDIPENVWGVYDVRTDPPKRLGDHLTLFTRNSLEVEKPFDLENAEAHLLRCNAVEESRRRVAGS